MALFGGFAGASAEGKLALDLEWCKNKTAKFDMLSAIGGTAAGTALLGAEGKFEFSYADGKVRFESGLMLTLGIGGRVGLSFEIGVDKAIELFSHLFRSVDWHRVDAVTLLAFEFYVNVTFANIIAAGKLGEYVFEKAKGYWDWFDDQKMNPEILKQSKTNIRNNIGSVDDLKNSPPETKGHLILTLMATTEEDDFNAIIKILEAAETDHELKWVLRNAQDAIPISTKSTDKEKGDALDEGIKRVGNFGNNLDEYSTYVNRFMEILNEKNIMVR